MRKLSWCLLSVLALGGCFLSHRAPGESSDAPSRLPDGGAAAVSGCIERTLRPGQQAAPIDMVWVVDSSRSMVDEQARIRQTINEFVADAQARSFDVRLVMITEANIVPAPLGVDSLRFRFVQRNVASSAPLQALLDELPLYQTFLRPDAALHFVVVTDDESELRADEFRRQMSRALRRAYVVHAVASPDVDGRPCRSQTPSEQCAANGGRVPQICGAAAIGREYYALAAQLGGEQISICLDDWRDVFGPLLDAVTPTEIPCIVELGPAEPLAPARVELRQGESKQLLPRVESREACDRVRGFYYVEQPAGFQLALCPAACSATTLAGVELNIQVACD